MGGHRTGHTENLNRLRRVEGQVRGIQRMIEEREYCIDILTQIQAIRSALQSVSRQILGKHIKHCVADAIESGDDQAIEEKIKELQNMVKRMEN